MTNLVRKTAIAALAAMFSFGVIATASAQTATDRREDVFAARDARQQTRIANGIANGQINSREAARLEAQQSRIDRAEARAEANGRVNRREFARIEARQNRASAHIYRARHNGR
jgi:hypothetical protein